jgi:hypothetical protein
MCLRIPPRIRSSLDGSQPHSRERNDYVVNTNYHGDHKFGNYAFPQGTLYDYASRIWSSMST